MYSPCPLPAELPPVVLPLGCPAAVRKAVGVLRKHLGPISTDELAAEVSASKWFLCRQFHCVMGEPPGRLHRRWRLELGAMLLRAGQSPGAVAAAVGFADQAHFTRHFSKTFGMPPGRYGRVNAASVG